MLDYKLLEALALVVDEGGFEKAARRLHITQSAISQRIKMLEESVGTVLLSRTAPPTATTAGHRYLSHYRMVKQLEDDMLPFSPSSSAQPHTSLAIGVNADSLATWFIDAIEGVARNQHLVLDIHVDDQEETLKLLQTGVVCGCISTHAKPLQGCRIVKLGAIEYGMFATLSFAERWFASGFQIDSKCPAPTIRFNRKDHLNRKFLDLFPHLGVDGQPTFFMPSSEKFVECIVRGLCYGLIPAQQSRIHCQSGKLVNLAPSCKILVDLFYHYWNLKSVTLETFSQELINHARQILATDP